VLAGCVGLLAWVLVCIVSVRCVGWWVGLCVGIGCVGGWVLVMAGGVVVVCSWWRCGGVLVVCWGADRAKIGVVWGCGHGVLYGRPSVRPEKGIQKPVQIWPISALPESEGWFERGWCIIGPVLGVSGGLRWRVWLDGQNIRGKRPSLAGARCFVGDG